MDKPTEITAKQFLDEGYVTKIAANECVVRAYGQSIRALSKHDGMFPYMVWPMNDSEASGLLSYDETLAVEWLPQPAPATAPTVAGEDDFRDLYMSAGGLLAIIAGWLRGADSDMTAQNIYDMIATEQGMQPATITDYRAENERLRGELDAAYGVIESKKKLITRIYDEFLSDKS